MITDPDYLMIVGIISQLPAKEREKVTNFRKSIENVIAEDREMGLLALTWLGIELQHE